MNIHPTAVVESGASLDKGVTVGAYAYIGAHAVIGANTVIEHHATVDGYTTIGKNNHVYPYAFIGGKTHDLKHKGGICRLDIGDGNTFREYVSVHTATADDDATVIGNDNYLLAYSHIGHDCRLGDRIIMSAQVATGGHVHIDDYANIGGNSSIHQFCRIGAYSMLAGHSFLKKDLPPFMIAAGAPAVVKSYNRIGMMRNNFPEEERDFIKECFKLLYESHFNRTQALAAVRKLPNFSRYPKIKGIFEAFFEEKSQRGLI